MTSRRQPEAIFPLTKDPGPGPGRERHPDPEYGKPVEAGASVGYRGPRANDAMRFITNAIVCFITLPK